MDKQAVNKDWQVITAIIEKLRAKVLCQICSEVYSVQFNCGHKFCETCFTVYTETREIKCPVCKKHGKSSSYGKDIYRDALGKFTSFLINNDDKSDDPDNIKNINIPSVEHLDNSPKKNKQKKCKQLKNHKLDDEKPNDHPIIDNNIPSVQPVNSSKKKEEKKSLEGSKKRKIDDNTPDDPPALKENNIPSAKPIKSSRKNEKKVFQDSKKQKLNDDKANNPQTMSHNNIPSVEPSLIEDKIKNFQNSKLYKLVEDWLQASQNKLTHTQTCQQDEMNLLSLSWISLPSVSERTSSTPALKKPLEEQFQRTEDDVADMLLDQFEQVKIAKMCNKSKRSPTGRWKGVQEIKKNVKCRKRPKQPNVTVNTSQSCSSKRERKDSTVAESPVKETHLTDSKSESQHLNMNRRRLNSSILQQASSCLSTLPLNITKNAEDLLFLAPTQKINTDPDNFEDLNLTFEDEIMVLESVQAEPTKTYCNQQTQTVVYSRNIAIQCHVGTSSAEVQTDPEHPIIHEEELLANSLDCVNFDTEDLIGKTTTKKPSQNLHRFGNKSAFDNQNEAKNDLFSSDDGITNISDEINAALDLLSTPIPSPLNFQDAEEESETFMNEEPRMKENPVQITRYSLPSDPLFKDFKFYFYFNDPSCMEEGARNAVSKLGGTICKKVVDLIKTDGKIPLIIVEDRMSQKDLCERWSELYDIAVVDLEWLSLCIARYQIVGILNYTCCSVDSLREWKYPNYLFRDD